MAGNGGRSWLKYGCFGCLALVAVLVLVGVVVVALAYLGARSTRVEEQVVTREVPAEVGAEAEPQLVEPPEAPGAARGRVVLDLSEADFRIRPAKPGEPIRVEASFDRESCTFEEGFDEPGPGGGWTYRVTFHRRNPGAFAALKELFGGARPELRVFLPLDVPLDLELRLARGGVDAELGGLWLESAALDVSMGGLELSVGEPLREPMSSLSLKMNMGGASIHSLGNASPRRLDIDYSMGGMELDLRGRWRADSDITLHGSMGGGEVRLPRDVRIEGLPQGAIGVQREPEIASPTLRFSADSAMGSLEFD
jgi:hypothetical protein